MLQDTLPLKGLISIFLTERASSVDTASGNSQDGNDSFDDGYENLQVRSISSLHTSISRGLSISIIKQKTVKVNFDIVDTRIISGHRKHVVSNCLLPFSGQICFRA